MSDYSGPYGVGHDPSEMLGAEAREKAAREEERREKERRGRGAGEEKKDRLPTGTADTGRTGRGDRTGAESQEGEGKQG